MGIFIQSIPLWVELISIAFCTGILVFPLWVFSDAEYPDRGSSKPFVASLYHFRGSGNGRKRHRFPSACCGDERGDGSFFFSFGADRAV